MRFTGNMVDDGGGYDETVSPVINPKIAAQQGLDDKAAGSREALKAAIQAAEDAANKAAEDSAKLRAAEQKLKDAKALMDATAAAKVIADADAALAQANIVTAKAAADKKIADAKAAADKAAADKAAADKAAADKAAADAKAAAAKANAAANATGSSATSTPTFYKYSGSPNTLTTSGSITAIPSTPTTPVAKTPPPPPVKTAPIDTVLFNDDSMSIEMMADLIFENIGGHELINIARNDIINGQQVSYTPIKNLGLIQQTYNPNNILRLQSTSEKYFANFAIKLEEKIPLVGNGPNGSNVYIDQTTGDLIIEGINMNKDELFEVELSLNGTIYEANFGATTS